MTHADATPIRPNTQPTATLATRAAVSFTRSQLFHVYNLARQAARRGVLDVARVNRALGILQSHDGAARLAQYEASVAECWCPDSRRRGQPCKHRIAVMIARRAGGQSQTGHVAQAVR